MSTPVAICRCLRYNKKLKVIERGNGGTLDMKEQKHAARKKRKPRIQPALIVGVVVVLIALILVFGNRGPDLSDEIKTGKEYLASLEEKDPADVQKVRKEIRKEKLEAERDELIRQLNAGEIDPFSMFQDYVLMGDSRSVGYEFWNYLDPTRVLADAGNTILSVEDQMEELVSLNPSTIYLCFGLNDVSIGIWSTAEEYAAEYMNVIASIQAELPDATIVVSSILPAKDPAFNRDADWYNIPDWNVVLKETCEENGILFADCDQLAVDYSDLWDIDGIHFQTNFYPHWATYLVAASLYGDVTEDTTEAEET